MNVAKWPMGALGEVMRRTTESVVLEPEATYREVTVRLWGNGVVLRSHTRGSTIAPATRTVVRKEQFIVSRIDARNGALGIVPAALDGAVVTNDFPSFELDGARLLPGYLGWLARSAWFVDLCRAASEGTTNRVRLKEAAFLAVTIPLPPLAEQRRIVAWLDAIAERVAEAKRLQGEVEGLRSDLTKAVELQVWPESSLGNAARLEDLTNYLARGRQSAQGLSECRLVKTQHVQMRRYIPSDIRLSPEAAERIAPEGELQDGDILVACSAAGCLGRVARYVADGIPATTDTRVAIARPKATVVDPEYLYLYLLGAQGQRQLRSRERGDWEREKVGFRLTELNLADLRDVPVPVPSIAAQRQIASALRHWASRMRAADRLAALSVASLEGLVGGAQHACMGGGVGTTAR